MRRLKWLVLFFVIAASALYFVAGRTAPQTVLPSKPNIIIYLVDTLRRDHLTVYGYKRRTSPNLEKFRKDSVLFEDAYTVAPWTRPSTASLLSGLPPRKHGAVSKMEKIHDDVKLVSQYLQQKGYGTACFSSISQVLPIWGFDRGFNLFQDIRKGSADKVVQAVMQQIPKFRNKPFFFYIHTMDPHIPNNPPEPYRSLWPRTFSGIDQTNDIEPDTPADVVEDMVTAYDEEIALNDNYFGELMKYLQKEDLYKDTLIFYVADHGEEFQDHGSGGHAHTLYQELMRIPMLVKLPGNQHANTTVKDRVWLLDVVPTLLSVVKHNPGIQLSGTNLFQFIGKNSASAPRTLYFDVDAASHKSIQYSIRSVLSGNMKYIERSLPSRKRQLFDLDNDPMEKQNLFGEKKEQAQMLAQKIEQHILENEGGMYLRFTNSAGETAASYQGKLITQAKLKDVQSWQFDPGDSMEIAADSKSLTFSVELKNLPDPIRPDKQWIDEDVIRFRVEPPDAEVLLESLSCSGCEQNGVRIGEDKDLVQTFPVRIVQSNNEFKASAFSPVFSLPGPDIFIIPFEKGTQVKLDDDTAERLKSLGYVQ